ncbi:MAG: insulinase family protein [Verrucomicrobiaceae bacterium]|nr:insulinase family protein [Verrucomicrobiaceae bacterium]
MKFLVFCMTALIATPALLAAESVVKAEGFTHVRTVAGIAEYTLDSNGLQVLMMPQKAVPVATFMVTYHVGSRNEVTGTTGATHLLEHLMFKGTEKYDRSHGTGFDQVLERVGAETNATTWLDRTNYFATVSANSLPLLIEVEADRMRNLALREEDRQPEMTVVRNEFERGENMPIQALSKELWAAAFMAHPYHHDTIGWRSDIERVPIEKLRAFYDTFYWPNNATVTVIGDFDAEETLAVIRQQYGKISRSPHPFPQMYTTEPEQTGQRRVMVKRGGELGVVAIAHKIPQASHPDWPALQVLSDILTHGKGSRCYRELTDKNLTIEVEGDAGFHHDPSLHILSAELAQDAKPEVVERKLVELIEKVKTAGVTAAEVQTAIAGWVADRAFESDGTFALASEINECIAVGDWTLYTSLEDKIKAVTPADVQRVAKQYLIEKHSVVGWFVPTSEESASEEPEGASTGKAFKPKMVQAPKPLKSPLPPPPMAGIAKRVVREQVAGIDVLSCPTGVKGIVHLSGSLPAGEAAAKNRALAYLASGMIERGTTKHDQFEMAEILEKVGASLKFTVKTDTLQFSAKCLTKDLPLVVSVIAEQLRTPAFASAELTKLKKELASELQQSLEDPDHQAEVAFSRVVYPEGHPARLATAQELVNEVKTAKLAEVKAFHAANYGPASMHLVAVGDFDLAAFKTDVAKAFDGWKPQPVRVLDAAAQETFERSDAVVKMTDKSSISVAIGQPSGLRAGDPDWLALRIGTDVLGQGFTSRLTGNVRDREGLTYGIGTVMRDDTYRSGQWSVSGTFAPSMLDQGMTSTFREIRKWWSEGVTADELDYRKSAVAGQFIVGLETTEGLADQLLLCIQRGFDLNWLDEFPAKVNALTLEEVNGAIKRRLDPDKMATVKAGVK